MACSLEFVDKAVDVGGGELGGWAVVVNYLVEVSGGGNGKEGGGMIRGRASWLERGGVGGVDRGEKSWNF